MYTEGREYDARPAPRQYSREHYIVIGYRTRHRDYKTFRVYLPWCPKGRFVYRTREGGGVGVTATVSRLSVTLH